MNVNYCPHAVSVFYSDQSVIGTSTDSSRRRVIFPSFIVVRLDSVLSSPSAAARPCARLVNTGPARLRVGRSADWLLLGDLNYGGKNPAVRARRQLVLG